MKTVIGIDYGTQSARALLIETESGKVLCSHSIAYPHGVLDGNLASAEDYDNVLLELLEAVIIKEYKYTIVGICVDATSLTLVPVAKDGKVLSQIAEFSNRHHAQIKLWKCHEAEVQAEEALLMAKEKNETFLGKTGGSISSEWMLPKLLKIRDEDKEIYDQIDMAMDLCEFLTFRLTGVLNRSIGPMSYKCFWSEDDGFPTDSYLEGLRDGFAKEYKYLLRGKILHLGEQAGYLKSELCERLGLKENIIVAAGIPDGNTSFAELGALQEADAVLICGTSNVLTIQTKQFCALEGICGIAKDGLIKGMYGIEAGQNCTGDMLEWYLKNMCPADLWQEAENRGISPHQLLFERIRASWDNSIIAADWWNGSRNMPCDLSLRGMISGLSLETKPEDIYLALLQGMVCGTREIIEQCEKNGIVVKRLLATGGMAVKNPLLMQEYANFLHRPVLVGQIKEGPAQGAAIYAALAAGIYQTPMEAYEHMGVHEFKVYEPDEMHHAEYEALYQKNHMLRKMIACMRKFAIHNNP